MPIFNDMTNKEAAKVLNDYSTVNRNASLPYINEAIHAAIKALSQIDDIGAQNAEYKARLGIDETVIPKIKKALLQFKIDMPPSRYEVAVFLLPKRNGGFNRENTMC